jgi:hypothetical protein
MAEAYYDVAQVCPNGHVISPIVGDQPEQSKTYCDQCGEVTLMQCPGCGVNIQGFYHIPGVVRRLKYDPPGFCFNCGKAFPWTERKQQAAIDLFIEETQDQDARKDFAESVGQITKDTPQAQVAGRRISKQLGKLGKGAAKAIWDIVISVASEAAKKGLMP